MRVSSGIQVARLGARPEYQRRSVICLTAGGVNHRRSSEDSDREHHDRTEHEHRDFRDKLQVHPSLR